MGIGPQALHLLSIINKKNIKGSVIELGAQELHRGLPSFIIDFPFEQYHQYRSLDKKEIKESNRVDVYDIYKKIGFKNYNAIDLNGYNESFKIDLNKKINNKNLKSKYSLVTNFGTSEHLLNQENFFYNSHYLCKKNGIMAGIVPFSRSQNHGFFKYTSLFFLSLANANDYEVELYLSYTNVNCYGFTLINYQNNIENRISKFERFFNILPSADDDFEIGYIFIKKSNSVFKIPSQIYDENFSLSKKKIFKYKKNNNENLWKFFLIYGKKKIFFRMIRMFRKLINKIF